MTYSVLIFTYRKPGTTPEQFRAHYESSHVPLIKEIVGKYVKYFVQGLSLFSVSAAASFHGHTVLTTALSVRKRPSGHQLTPTLENPRHFPLSHTRRYIHRTVGKAEGTERNAKSPASVLMGTQADFEYDALAELTFPDAGAFQTFFSIAQQPKNAARIAADEEKFLDRSKSKCPSFSFLVPSLKAGILEFQPRWGIAV